MLIDGAKTVGDHAGMVAVDETPRLVGEGPSRPVSLKSAIGTLGLGATLWLWATMTLGAHRIERLIAGYEQVHGQLDLSGGVVAHHSPEIEQLCHDLMASAGYFYPFGWLLFAAAAASWCICSAMALHDRRTWMFASWTAAILVLAVDLMLFAVPVYEMTIITE